MPNLILKKNGQEVSRYTLVTSRDKVNGKALVLTKGDKKLYGQLGLNKPSDVKGLKFYKDGQVWYLQKKNI